MHWLITTKAGIAVGFTALLGLLVGAVVTSQTLYAATAASQREFATLRAMGIPKWRLKLNVLVQSFWVGLFGDHRGGAVYLAHGRDRQLDGHLCPSAPHHPAHRRGGDDDDGDRLRARGTAVVPERRSGTQHSVTEHSMTDQPRRRIPGLGFIVAVALLVLPIAGVAWWLNRPKGNGAAGGQGLADLDVVCLGRVDGLTPIASLEPSIPGKVAEIFVSEGQPVKPGDKLVRLDDEALRLKQDESSAAFEAAEVDVAAAKLERTLYPFRKAAQEAAVAAAGERVTAAEKLLDEKREVDDVHHRDARANCSRVRRNSTNLSISRPRNCLVWTR